MWAFVAATLVAFLHSFGVPEANQARPDFSGHWRFAPDPAKPLVEVQSDPNNPRVQVVRIRQYGSFGPEFTARQDERSLTIVLPNDARGRPVPTNVFWFDGSESRNQQGPFWTVTTARWDGVRLILVTRIDDPRVPPSEPFTRVLWLEGPDTLVVETTDSKRTFSSVYVRAK